MFGSLNHPQQLRFGYAPFGGLPNVPASLIHGQSGLHDDHILCPVQTHCCCQQCCQQLRRITVHPVKVPHPAQLAVLLQRIDVLLFKDDGDALVGEDARHRPRGVGHDLVGVVFLLHLVAVCLILLAGDPAVGGYPELADQFVAFGYKNVRINLSLFEAMFFIVVQVRPLRSKQKITTQKRRDCCIAVSPLSTWMAVQKL